MYQITTLTDASSLDAISIQEFNIYRPMRIKMSKDKMSSGML